MVGGSLCHFLQPGLQGDFIAFILLHLAPYRILLKSLLRKKSISIIQIYNQCMERATD